MSREEKSGLPLVLYEIQKKQIEFRHSQSRINHINLPHKDDPKPEIPKTNQSDPNSPKLSKSHQNTKKAYRSLIAISFNQQFNYQEICTSSHSYHFSKFNGIQKPISLL